MGRKKKAAPKPEPQVEAKSEQKPAVKTALLKVKSIRPVYNNLMRKDLPMRIPCGWLGSITRATYDAYGGDKGAFVILGKIEMED